MDDEDDLLNWVEELVQAVDDLEVEAAFEKSKRWINRRWHTHPIYEGRQAGEEFFDTTFQELKLYPERFRELVRMEPDTFDTLLTLVEPDIRPMRQTRTAIKAEHRLALTLMYLAHGTPVAFLASTNRIAKSTLYKVINQTCSGIFEALAPTYLKFPKTQGWRNIAKQFGEIWQMPGCLSAIDGKDIEIKQPDNSGSQFFNYKKTFSIVLMAAVNHNYEFMWVDVGQFGGQSDGGLLSRSDFGMDLENGTLNIPREWLRLPNSQARVPFYFIGDEAFRLRLDFMKPFPGQNLTEDQRQFNYRLSRARRCVESAFGILAMRWRILDTRIGLNPDSVESIVNACLCLHNFLSTMRDAPKDIVRYKLNQEKRGIQNFGEDYEVTDNREGYNVREKLMKYFVSDQGRVPWQLERVRRGLNLNNANQV